MTNGVDSAPYVGLRAFDEEDGYKFFGRTRESYEIAALWQANRFTVLYGPSGVGKTSLLQAGVIPLLDPTRTDLFPLGRVSHASAFPVAALSERNPYTFALLSSWSPMESPTRLSGLRVLDFLRRRGERIDQYGDPVPTLVAIDQAEELFSDFTRRQPYRQKFIDELVEAMDELPGLHLLLSTREDYLAAVLTYERELGRRARARFQLLPFNRDAALDATRRPLAGTHRSFALGAAETLVDDLRTVRIVSAIGDAVTIKVDTVEPVYLQVVCTTLWRSLHDDVREITSQHVRQHADVDRALAEFCNQALTAVSEDHDLPVTELRSWLQRTFVTELGTRDTAYEGLTQTAGMPNAVVRALEDRHVLKAELRSGARWYELQHDRLIKPIQQADAETLPHGTEPPAQTSAEEYLRAAELALVSGELAVAEKHAEEALRACSPADVRIRAEIESFLGNIAHERGRPEGAAEHYRTAARLFEALQDTLAVGQLLAAIGQSLLAQGRRNEAVDELRAAVTRVPNDLTVQTELAWALWHSGHPRAAVPVLSSVLAIDGNTPEALQARGEILADLGEAEEALRDLDRVRRRLRPTSRAGRGIALATLGRIGEAEQEVESALAEAGDSGTVLLYAARVRALGGDPASAADLARRARAATDPALPAHQRAEADRLIRELSPEMDRDDDVPGEDRR
jgi:tetratricopeptide (TPR) repeat protein